MIPTQDLQQVDVLPAILFVIPVRGLQLLPLAYLAAAQRTIASSTQPQIVVTVWVDITNLQDGLTTTTTISISEFLASDASTLVRPALEALLASPATPLSSARWDHQDIASAWTDTMTTNFSRDVSAARIPAPLAHQPQSAWLVQRLVLSRIIFVFATLAITKLALRPARPAATVV